MPDGDDRDLWLRRQALILAVQLPEDVEEAKQTLRYVEHVVDGFMQPQPEQPDETDRPELSRCPQKLRIV